MYLAIDIGGTKTLFASFSADGKLLKKHKFPTPEEYDAFITEFERQFTSIFPDEDFRGAAIAIPGRLDRKHGIALAFGNRPWENVPMAADFEKLIHCPTLIENDARTAGLSEALNVKDEFKKVLYVTVSTGIGAGLIINGKIDPETADNEVGQILLEFQGRLTRWEDFASGKAFYEKYGKRVSDITDPHAWYYIARNIAIGLTTLVATYTPEVIILGGGVGANLEKFHDRLVEAMKIYENPMFTVPPIRKAKNAEEAVIYGCYELARQRWAPLKEGSGK